MKDKRNGLRFGKDLSLSLAMSFSIMIATQAHGSDTPIEPSPPEIPDVEAIEPNDSVGQCWFHPLKEDKGIKCKASYTVCQPGHPHCDSYMWVWCQNRLIFKGIYSGERDSYSVIELSALPIGHYADPPTIYLYLTKDTSPAAIYAILNYDGKNRSGSCSWPATPLP